MPTDRQRWLPALAGWDLGARTGRDETVAAPPAPAVRLAPDDSFGRLLFETTRDAAVVVTAGGDVLEVNDAACQMFEADAETMRVLGRRGLSDTGDRRRDAFLAERAATGSARGQLRLRRASGSTFEADVFSQALETPEDEQCFLIVVRELTELHRLEGVEHGYRSLFQSAYDGIAVFALDGTIVDINDACAALLARPREELLGSHFSDHVPREAVLELEALLVARIDGDSGGRRYETAVVSGSGERIPVEITSAVLTESRRAAGLTCVIRDLRERRAAEREQAQLEAQLRHAEKLKSLGVLAGGIAHDFNNLLLAVLGHASIARTQLPPDSSVQESLAAIEMGAQRCADLANQMLAYAGRSDADLQPVHANEELRALDRLLRASIPRRVELRFDLGDDLPAVLADPGQLRQVLLNLITNAADAIGDADGTVTLATRRRTVAAGDEVVSVLGAPIEPGDYVELRVDDTGSGMDELTRQRIFEPFFTTKRTGHGLGLAAAAGIIRSHRGAIELHSSPGQGSSFRILLPSVADSARAHPASAPAAEAGEGVVLVIDDDEQVSAVASRMLEYFGYTVRTAATASEGVALVASDPAIGAVVLDLNLPGSSGGETLEELHATRSELPVLLMSGFGREVAPANGNVSFIQKPFTADELVRRLQDTIARESAAR